MLSRLPSCCLPPLPFVRISVRAVRFFTRSSSWRLSSMASPGSPVAHAAPPLACSSNPFDRSVFNRQIHLVAIRVLKERAEVLQKALSSVLLRMPFNANVRPIVKDPSSDAHRMILLAESTTPPDMSGLTDTQKSAVSNAGGETTSYELTIGYQHMSMDDVLKAVIPPGLAGSHELPTSFEIAGHVAHLNLREEYLPWKYVIAQVILDKNPQIKTVVNKTGVIHETFRTFPMELLAGKDDTHVEVRHCGAIFRFDFRRVYWNSRLAYEHAFIVEKVIPSGSVVADMFCGVGPFAIPLALAPRSCTVHANDLNPASHEALVANVRSNKVSPRVVTYNMDGRDFIRRLVHPHAQQASSSVGSGAGQSTSQSSSAPVPFTHVLMNLPADALSFLDVFVGLYRGVSIRDDSREKGGSMLEGTGTSDTSARGAVALPLPRIHVYCFVKTASLEKTGIEPLLAAHYAVASRLLDVLTPDARGTAPPHGSLAALDAARTLLPDLAMRHIRDVSPRKLMLCASFTLPRSVAVAGSQGHQDAAESEGGDEPQAKRAKHEHK